LSLITNTKHRTFSSDAFSRGRWSRSGSRRGAEGGAGETDEGEGEEDDDESSSSGYESPEDPHPQPPRMRPMEDELDLNFDPNEEVGMEPL
jgi:hypothetical protein